MACQWKIFTVDDRPSQLYTYVTLKQSQQESLDGIQTRWFGKKYALAMRKLFITI